MKLRKVAILGGTSQSYTRNLIAGIARYAQQHTQWIFYQSSSDWSMISKHMASWNPNGIIAHIHKNSIADRFPKNLPLIAIEDREHIKNFPSILPENEVCAELAAEHFLNKGFRHFAFCGFSNMPWSIERESAFSHELSTYGITVDCFRQSFYNYTHHVQDEQMHLMQWLESLPKPIALLACNDIRGHHVVEACRIANLQIPESVAILGIDNDIMTCELCNPPLSSIALNTKIAGYEAAKRLDQLMEKKIKADPNDNILVKATNIVPRHSTDIFAISDPAIVKALHYIFSNKLRMIQVDEVAGAAMIARRALERRFKKVLGRSILDEIRRVRIEHICKLLLESNLSVAEISEIMNFPDGNHISRYFKKGKGVSLVEFRKQILPNLEI